MWRWQVKLETLKLLKEFVSAPMSTKQAVAKSHSILLPAVAKSANEAAPELREVRLLAIPLQCVESPSTRNAQSL